MGVTQSRSSTADRFTSNVERVYSLDILLGGIAGMAFIVIESPASNFASGGSISWQRLLQPLPLFSVIARFSRVGVGETRRATPVISRSGDAILQGCAKGR